MKVKTAPKTRNLYKHLSDLRRRTTTLTRDLCTAQEAVARAAEAVHDLENDLADLLEFADTLETLVELTSAPGVPERHRVLDVSGPGDQLVLDRKPLEWLHGDGNPRPISRTAECGRLLLDLAMEESLEHWEPRALSRALQQLKRSSALGRKAIVGRGRHARLATPIRLASTLAVAETCRRAVKERRPR